MRRIRVELLQSMQQGFFHATSLPLNTATQYGCYNVLMPVGVKIS